VSTSTLTYHQTDAEIKAVLESGRAGDQKHAANTHRLLAAAAVVVVVVVVVVVGFFSFSVLFSTVSANTPKKMDAQEGPHPAPPSPSPNSSNSKTSFVWLQQEDRRTSRLPSGRWTREECVC